MKRLIILFCCLLSYPLSSLADEQGKPDWMDKIFIGGNVGATFGTVTNVNISPMIGYKITDRTLAGVSVTYQYIRDSRFNPEISSSIYGGGPWARQFITDEIFLHGEYELLNYERFISSTSSERTWLGTGLVGGGYRYGNFFLTALYILNHQASNSPYGEQPYVIRVGVGI